MMANGWQEVPLREVVEPINRTVHVEAGTSYRTIGVKWWGMGAYERETIDGSMTAARTLSIVREGDLIINKIWVRHGSVAIATRDVDGCVGSGEFPTFRLDLKRIDPRWIHWQTKMMSFWEKCDNLSRGTSGKNRIKPELFLTIRIPLPPLAEQRRIVERIQALAGRVAKAQSLRREAREESAVLVDTAVGKVFSAVKAIECKPLKELTTKIGSGSTPSGGRAIYQQSGIPFIRSMNVRMRQFQWDDIAYIDSEIHKNMLGTWVKSNDVLLNITGASIGRVACAPPDLIEGNVNQHVCIIRPIDTIDSKFLMYWLSQPIVQDFINDEQKGATRQGFTKAQIERFEIPLFPLDEQRRLVAYLDGLQAQVAQLRALQEKSQKELDALMPSILDKAFKGEL
jgi:type I restriction enzyme, S subunit